MENHLVMSRMSIAVIAFALCVASVHAQPVYKYQMPDGRIVYTSEKLPNAKLLGTVREPLPAQPVDAARQSRQQNEKNAVTQSSNKRLAALAAADTEVSAALQAVADAKARQAAGAEVQEGERVGTVRSGLGRARDAYLERQSELQAAVDAAQKRLDRAYEARNAAR